MARSVFRFLSRQSDTVTLESETHLLRLPRFSDYRQWYLLRSESRRFLEPWEPTWRSDELSESSFRSRVVRNEQEFASGQALPLFLFLKAEQQLLGGLTIGYIRRGASQHTLRQPPSQQALEESQTSVPATMREGIGAPGSRRGAGGAEAAT